MIKILHLIDTTGPGGAETVFVQLCTLLDKQQYEPCVIISGPGWVYDSLVAQGISPYIINAKKGFNFSYLREILQLVKHKNINLIQAHLFGASVYAAIVGLISRKPVVATLHGAVDISHDERFIFLKRLILKWGVKSLVVVSVQLASEIANRIKFKQNRINVIHNGVDLDKFRLQKSGRLRKKYNIPDNSIVLGCVGNIRKAKGYPYLLNACAILKAKKLEFNLIIAGEGKGPLYEELQIQLKKLNLVDDIFFEGFVSDVPEFLSNIDIFVLPSISEGFSITTVEAMASGLPIVATRSGGPETILLDRETGLLVPPESGESIAAGIELLMKTPDLCTAMSKKAKAEAKNKYSLQKMINHYHGLYQNLT